MAQQDGKPVNFGIILFPGFQLLDACGPLDALNCLSQSNKMNLFIIAETMDPVSTKWPTRDDGDDGASAAYKQKQGSAFAQEILPTHTFANAPPLDVLIVPGGVGTLVVPSITPAVDFIRRTFGSGPGHEKQPYLITICTGADLAARAGVLDGKRATTNKSVWKDTTAKGPRVEWVWRARWVRADGGRVWTASGVSAGIDVTFAWMAEVYGEETAESIARMMEYRRVTDPEDDPFAVLEEGVAAS